MLSVDQALAAYTAELAPLPVETIPVTAALGRVLRSDALSRIDLPRHSQSALDGYVLPAADAIAGQRLRVTEAIAAGDSRALTPLAAGCAQRIFTGARVPPDCTPQNAVVVAQERVSLADGHIELTQSLKPGANIRWQGEEARAGSLIARAGQRLNPGLIASLVSAGVAEVRVSRAPRIAVLVSGDELRPIGTALEDGQIWDSNGPMVLSWLAAQGYRASSQSLPDRREAVIAAMDAALQQHDLLLTTGGVSVGDHDHIILAAESLGLRRVFWQVAQKPGKPLYFAVAPSSGAARQLLPEGEGKSSRLDFAERQRQASAALLGLPGNPGAVLVGLALHSRRVLDLLEGCTEPGPTFATGVLEQPVKADAQRERLLRMTLSVDAEGRNRLRPLPYQDSHMLSNLDRATVLVRLPARECDYQAGERLQWTSL